MKQELCRKRRAWQHAQLSLCGARRNTQAFWIHHESEAIPTSCLAWQDPFQAVFQAEDVTPASAPKQTDGLSTVNAIQAEMSCPPPPPPPGTPSKQHLDSLNAVITCEARSVQPWSNSNASRRLVWMA